MYQFGIFDYNLKNEVKFIKYLDMLKNPLRNPTEIPKRSDSEDSIDNGFKSETNNLLMGFIIIVFGSTISVIVFAIEHALICLS